MADGSSLYIVCFLYLLGLFFFFYFYFLAEACHSHKERGVHAIFSVTVSHFECSDVVLLWILSEGYLHCGKLFVAFCFCNYFIFCINLNLETSNILEIRFLLIENILSSGMDFYVAVHPRILNSYVGQLG